MSELYQNLIFLCTSDECFYYKDVQLDSIKYRIFNYRLCSYEQFYKYPSGLSCRGTMFNINDPQNIQLVCLPPEKFFNYEEGNGENVHQLNKLGIQMDKIDGSLISTYLHNQQHLRLKSKASLTSTQALEAMDLLTGKFRDEIEDLVHRNYTVNMEYTSPLNQIVLYYPESKLRVLSIRSHLTEETLFADKLIVFLKENNYLTIIENLVLFKIIPIDLTQKNLVESIRKEIHGEGYVVEIIRPDNSYYLVKIKCERYLLLHHTKFSCTPKYIFQCVINEQTDDLRSLFVHENNILEKITNMEEQVMPKFNKMIQLIELFYQENKDLSRKDYAIKAKNTLDIKNYFSLIMNLYTGKENDYKKFAIDHSKDLFHISDENNIANIDQE